jgi:hypothetical protein
MPPIPGQPAADIQATDTLEVSDPSGGPSPLIIRRSDAFKVGMEFEIRSVTTQALLGALTYEVKYFAESIGPGTEYGPFVVAKRTVAGQNTYNTTTPLGNETALTIAANTLDAGVYRLGAMVSFRLDPGPPFVAIPYPMTAFVEGPAIEVYP